jgi:hypothetical protein
MFLNFFGLNERLLFLLPSDVRWLRHPHYYICHSVGLLFAEIPRPADSELGLEDTGSKKFTDCPIADGPLEDHDVVETGISRWGGDGFSWLGRGALSL